MAGPIAGRARANDVQTQKNHWRFAGVFPTLRKRGCLVRERQHSPGPYDSLGSCP